MHVTTKLISSVPIKCFPTSILQILVDSSDSKCGPQLLENRFETTCSLDVHGTMEQALSIAQNSRDWNTKVPLLILSQSHTYDLCYSTVWYSSCIYRIAGIFRGVIFSWFSWSRGEPRNICTRKSANRVRAPKTTKFFPRNSQNYDFHENITTRKIPTIRYES